MKCVHVELKPVGRPLLNQEDDCGNDDCDNRDRRRKVMVGSGFTEVLVIDDNRESLIALSDQQRCAVVGECTHEYKQRCRKNGRHTQRDNDLEEALHTGNTHVFGCLKQ